MFQILITAALATSGAVPAFATETHRFNVPVEAPSDAVRDFAAQAHVQILVDGENIKDKRFHAVLGEFSTEKGLKVLLAGSGLIPQYVADHSIALVAQSQDASGVSQNGDSKDADGQRATASTRVQGKDATSDPSPATGEAQREPDKTNNVEEREGIEQIIVTAQKRAQRLQDVPVSMSVLNADTLTDSSQALVKDYYSAVPGLVFQPAFSGTQTYTIRGIAEFGGDPTTGITIDDMPFGPATLDVGGTFIPDIDPGELARVEVLRGPQGTLYGANSEGGLVKFVTKDPSTEDFSGRLEAGTNRVFNGSGPGFNLRASANIPISDTVAIRVSGYDRLDAGYIDNPVYHLDGTNQTDTYGGRLATLWHPLETVSLKLSAMLQRTKSQGPSEVVDLPGLGDLQNNYLPNLGGTDTTIQVYGATLSAKLGGVDLTSVTGYNIVNRRPTLDFSGLIDPEAIFPTTFGGVTSSGIFYHIPTRTFTQEIRLSGSLGPVDWLMGGFYKRDIVRYRFDILALDSVTEHNVGSLEDYFAPRTDDEKAGFADLTYHVTDRFDIQVGARESYIGLTFSPQVSTGAFIGAVPVTAPEQTSNQNAFTYLVTPELKFSRDFMAYVRLASGFRPGGVNTPDQVAAGAQPAYKPDQTQNYELGFRGDLLEHRLSIDASLYHINWRDIQLAVATPNGLFNYTANGGSAKSEGVEFSLQARPVDGLTVASWISYDNAVLTRDFPATSTVTGFKGERLPSAARVSANISLEEDFLLWSGTRGFIGGMASRVGERLGPFTADDQRQVFPAYTKTDLHIGVRHSDWTTSLYANNIADARGLLNGGAGYLYPPARFYITPRTIGLTVVRAF